MNQASEPAPIHPALHHFDKLPDSAGARAPTVAAVFGVSVQTVWRWSRNKRLPTPTKRGRVTTWQVGELRKVLEAASTDTGTRTEIATAAAAAKRNTAPAV